MNSFNLMLSRLTEVLQRSDETEIDYSLKDAKRLIETAESSPTVVLVESDRANVRDIRMTLTWDNHIVTLSIVASARFFVIRNAPLHLNGKQTEWCWDPVYDKFSCETDEETRRVFWEFLTAISNVL